MKKTSFIIAAFAGLVAFSCAVTKQNSSSAFKNLQVLPQQITEKQLDSVMHHFTAALNVKCNFCHAKNEATGKLDFASDENKHKLVARNMMRMTQKINDQFFKVADTKTLDAKLMVTCFTCHHGSPEPTTRPPLERKGK